jgi:hypothetical protein
MITSPRLGHRPYSRDEREDEDDGLYRERHRRPRQPVARRPQTNVRPPRRGLAALTHFTRGKLAK